MGDASAGHLLLCGTRKTQKSLVILPLLSWLNWLKWLVRIVWYMRAALRAVDTDSVMIPDAIYWEAQHTVKQRLAVDAKANKKRNAPEFEGFYIRPLSPLRAPHLTLLQYFKWRDLRELGCCLMCLYSRSMYFVWVCVCVWLILGWPYIK